MIVTIYMLYIYKQNETTNKIKIQKHKNVIKKKIIPAVKPSLDKSQNTLLQNINDINNIPDK